METETEKTYQIHTPGVWMPDEYTVRFQKQPEDITDKWKETGVYCPVCFSVSKDVGVFSRLGETDPKDANIFISWEVALKDLVESAQAGCHFCCFMIVRFFNDPMYMFFFGHHMESRLVCCYKDENAGHSEEVIKAIATVREKIERHGNPRFKLIARPDDYSTSDHGYERIRFLVDSTNLNTSEAVEDILGYRRQIVIEVSTFEGNEASEYLKGRPINNCPGSSRSIARVNKWLTECLDDHKHCKESHELPGCGSQMQNPQTAILPDRVVKILDDDHLVLTAGLVPGKYTILSYCWGQVVQDFATVKNTVASKQKGFAASQLPGALQDAIKLTRQLGVEYIWIDSLCIIQDSPEDKESQLPQMPSYYRNALVTICSAGESCDNRFLEKKFECENHVGTELPKDLLRTPFFCPNGETGVLLFREENPYDLSAESISKRGWCFQERLLSPRVIIYGSRITWECNFIRKTDGGVQDWSFDPRNFKDQEVRQGLSQARQATSPAFKDLEAIVPKSQKSLDLHMLWYNSVQEFSSRKTTFEEDKFPAIAALASEFATGLEDEYLAGLWTKDLLRGLMWSTWPSLTSKKPSKWRAPSWSWASLDHAVTYERLPEQSALKLAQVVGTEVVSKVPSFPFGEITSAAIKLEAPIIQLESGLVRKILEHEYQSPAIEDSATWRKLFLSTMPAYLGPKEGLELHEECFFLPIFAEQLPSSQDTADGKCATQDTNEDGTENVNERDSQEVGNGKSKDRDDGNVQIKNKTTTPGMVETAATDTDKESVHHKGTEDEGGASYKEIKDVEQNTGALLSGLVLARADRDAYRRVATIYRLHVKAYKSMIKGRVETVRLV